ncbi:MAG: DUF4860 domain-containing protein [Intestinimonas sp.]|jgi:hypothetical protein|nr:DUF4860 domain-containing protein [Intestinimonas sp.]
MSGKLYSALAIFLCAMFFLLAMGLTLLSAEAYRNTAAAASENDTRRTALSFLVNQVRRNDAQNSVSLASFGDGDALILSETVDGSLYKTVLYCFDGQLRELYAAADSGLGPADGLAILPLKTLTISVSDGLLITFTVTDENGTASSASVSPHCWSEGVAAS